MFEINENQRKRIFVVDHFYKDPDVVRRFALNQNFVEDKWYKGKRTMDRFLSDEIKHSFEKIIGQDIIAWEEHGMNGRFQYCTPEDLLVYHYDGQSWAGVLYLTPNAPYDTGTALFAHKQSGCRDVWESMEKKVDCFSGGFYDSTKFEVVDVVGNIYNRLVIFDAKAFHSASKYFGTRPDDSRLFQIFFFD